MTLKERIARRIAAQCDGSWDNTSADNRTIYSAIADTILTDVRRYFAVVEGLTPEQINHVLEEKL